MTEEVREVQFQSREKPKSKRGGNKYHTFTDEDRAKGGKSMTVYRSLKLSLANKRNCSVKCNFFDSCPMAPMALGSPDKSCLMNKFPETVKKQFVDLFLTGREGMIAGIKKVMFDYMNDVNTYGNLRDKKEMIRLLMDLYGLIYDPKQGQNQNKEPLQIIIKRVSGNVQEAETITVTPHQVLPMEARKLQTGLDSQDVVGQDSESLMGSDRLEEIIGGSKRFGHLVAEEIQITTNVEKVFKEVDDEPTS
jgi:hypothetical protein